MQEIDYPRFRPDPSGEEILKNAQGPPGLGQRSRPLLLELPSQKPSILKFGSGSKFRPDGGRNEPAQLP